jgi:hypothetical protein
MPRSPVISRSEDVSYFFHDFGISLALLFCSCLRGVRGYRGLSEPGFKARLAESCVIARNQCSFADFRARVKRFWVRDDFAGIFEAARRLRTKSSRRNCSGPPISTIPFTGALTAILPTAVATSSAAIGWKSTGGRCTLSPTMEMSAIPLMNSKNCVAWMMV